MHHSPEVRRARTAPRESRRSYKRLGKIAAGSILFATAIDSVLGQQQCTRTGMKKVFVESAPPAPSAIPSDLPSIPPAVSRSNPKRKAPITTSASQPPNLITAVTVPREQDLFYALKECEEEWQEQGLFIAYNCAAYSCSPPHCMEGAPGYSCRLDSEDRSLDGQRIYFDLDLDHDVVTVTWSPAVLSGPMVRFPSDNFCDELATQEKQRRRRFSELEDSLKPFLVVPSMVTTSGWRKFSLQINPCESRLRLDISPDSSVGIIYGIDPGIDPGIDSTSFEVFSLSEVQLALETFCSPSITY